MTPWGSLCTNTRLGDRTIAACCCAGRGLHSCPQRARAVALPAGTTGRFSSCCGFLGPRGQQHRVLCAYRAGGASRLRAQGTRCLGCLSPCSLPPCGRQGAVAGQISAKKLRQKHETRHPSPRKAPQPPWRRGPPLPFPFRPLDGNGAAAARGAPPRPRRGAPVGAGGGRGEARQPPPLSLLGWGALPGALRGAGQPRSQSRPQGRHGPGPGALQGPALGWDARYRLPLNAISLSLFFTPPYK